MTDKNKKGWVKFVPSLNLPKERVSIAYDTHDERGYRFAYGYFQFYNGTCSCFWKDGNEQPKVVKAEDIKYWMPVPPLVVQEEPVSEQNLSNVQRFGKNWKEPVSEDLEEAASVYQTFHRYATPFKAYVDGAQWKEQQFEKNRVKHCNSITNEQAELEQEFIDQHLDRHQRMPTFLDAIEYGMRLREQQMMARAVDGEVGYWNLRGLSVNVELPRSVNEGDKVKVILIKEK